MNDKRPCPLCNGRKARKLRELDRERDEPGTWTLMQCSACGMVYLGERVAYEDQARDYDWEEALRGGPEGGRGRRRRSGRPAGASAG